MCLKCCFSRCCFEVNTSILVLAGKTSYNKRAQTIVLAPSLKEDDAKTPVVAGQLESFVFSTHQGSQSGAQSVGLAAKLALKLLLWQRNGLHQV